MQTVNKMKEKGQAEMDRLVAAGKKQPGKLKVWSVTIGSAAIGGVAVAALAKTAVVLATAGVAAPVALGTGAVAGGIWGWRRMHPAGQEGAAAGADATPFAEATAPAPAEGAVPL